VADIETPGRAAVIGLGAMGAGIAEVFARAGWSVIGIEADERALTRGRTILGTSTDRAVERGKLTLAEQVGLLDRVTFSTSLSDARDAEFVVEAVIEDLAAKTAVFTALDTVVSDDAVLTTNTSSLSVTAIAAATSRPGRVVGVHFFNPAPVQPLIEVISTILTEAATLERVHTLLAGLGKTAISCSDRAGFVVNRLLVGYFNRAVQLYADGFATREQIDQAMVKAGYPMGPLTLLDLLGLDVSHAVLVRLYDETRDRLLAPAPLLTQLVTARLLGRKSGRGFYGYANGVATDTPGAVAPRASGRAGELPLALIAPYLNDALAMVQSGFASPGDIDTGMSLGCRMPKPFDVIAELGPRQLLATQQAVFAETAEPGHRPALLLERLAGAPDPRVALEALRAEA
jgi:3-hydroxybutyryl-CoA dehydrogenase